MTGLERSSKIQLCSAGLPIALPAVPEDFIMSFQHPQFSPTGLQWVVVEAAGTSTSCLAARTSLRQSKLWQLNTSLRPIVSISGNPRFGTQIMSLRRHTYTHQTITTFLAHVAHMGCKHIDMHTYVRTYVRTYIHTCIHTHIHVRTYTYTYMHIYLHT